jgi:hypothetical protein
MTLRIAAPLALGSIAMIAALDFAPMPQTTVGAGEKSMVAELWGPLAIKASSVSLSSPQTKYKGQPLRLIAR